MVELAAGHAHGKAVFVPVGHHHDPFRPRHRGEFRARAPVIFTAVKKLPRIGPPADPVRTGSERPTGIGVVEIELDQGLPPEDVFRQDLQSSVELEGQEIEDKARAWRLEPDHDVLVAVREGILDLGADVGSKRDRGGGIGEGEDREGHVTRGERLAVGPNRVLADPQADFIRSPVVDEVMGKPRDQSDPERREVEEWLPHGGMPGLVAGAVVVWVADPGIGEPRRHAPVHEMKGAVARNIRQGVAVYRRS